MKIPTMNYVLFFVLWLLFGCSENPNQGELSVAPETSSEGHSSVSTTVHRVDVSQKSLRRIRTEKVAERLTPYVVTAPGHVALDLAYVAKVSSRISGQVDKVMSKLGNQVKKGQPLAAIESLKLDELIQEYLVSKAKVDVAKSNFQRTQELLDENIVSKRRFLEDRGRDIEAQAVYQHVREKLLNMGLTSQELHELEHGSHLEGHTYILRSPLSGTIVHQRAVLGQGIAAGEELFEIVDTRHVWIFANLPIEQARRFKEGDQGKVIPRGGEPIQAKLTYISPVAEEATRTIRFRFDVNNTDGQLKPNEYVDVQLVDAQRPMLSIPNTAITMVRGERGVFVQDQLEYKFVAVEFGQEGDGLVEVISGLTVDAPVVTDGVFDLKNALLQDSIAGH